MVSAIRLTSLRSRSASCTRLDPSAVRIELRLAGPRRAQSTGRCDREPLCRYRGGCSGGGIAHLYGTVRLVHAGEDVEDQSSGRRHRPRQFLQVRVAGVKRCENHGIDVLRPREVGSSRALTEPMNRAGRVSRGVPLRSRPGRPPVVSTSKASRKASARLQPCFAPVATPREPLLRGRSRSVTVAWPPAGGPGNRIRRNAGGEGSQARSTKGRAGVVPICLTRSLAPKATVLSRTLLSAIRR